MDCRVEPGNDNRVCCRHRKTSKGFSHVHTAADRSRDLPEGDATRPHRSGAGVFQRAGRAGASDLETDRAGSERFRVDIDADMLAFLRKQAEAARYITSVCTGSLVLGAAGLLKGYRAATHWTAVDFLSEFGAIPAKTRVCVDRNRVTGGGVTAGIDFALTLVSIMVDRRTAEAIQLRLEYNPAAPFNSGSPDTAPAEILALMKERIAPAQARRSEAIHRAAARLNDVAPAG